MIGSLQDILSQVDVKPLDDLLKVKVPLNEPEHDAKSVTLRGLLVARNSMYIGLLSGDMLIQIACNAVKSAKLDKAPPAEAPKFGKYVILEIISEADLLFFRASKAAELGDGGGTLPFVLSIPSKSKDYAVAAGLVDLKNKDRSKVLAEQLIPIPFTPMEPWDPPASTLNSQDSGFQYNTSTPYDCKETRYWSTSFESQTAQLGFVNKFTDYKNDEDVFTSTDYSADVKTAKGNTFNVSTPFDTKTIGTLDSPYDTLQPGSASVTDHNLDYVNETNADSNGDIENVG